MAKEIKTNMKNHSVVSFYGGKKRGKCLQITTNNIKFCSSVAEQLQQPGFIQLDKEEAKHLTEILIEFIKEKNI